VVLKEEPVTWSRLALHSRRQGLVIVQATVNAQGRVDDVKILRADHEGFGIPQAVVESVHRYHFKPATKGGVAVKSYATVARRYRFADR
jgi:TonB family protein